MLHVFWKLLNNFFALLVIMYMFLCIHNKLERFHHLFVFRIDPPPSPKEGLVPFYRSQFFLCYCARGLNFQKTFYGKLQNIVVHQSYKFGRDMIENMETSQFLCETLKNTILPLKYFLVSATNNRFMGVVGIWVACRFENMKSFCCVL